MILTELPKEYTSITQVQLMELLENGELVPEAWYLITDYQTVKKINKTTVMHTGPVEQIFLQAASTNSVNPQGFSHTYPDEIIYFDPAKIVYTGSYEAVYEEGEPQDGEWAITLTGTNTFQISNGAILGDPADWTWFEIYIEDADEGTEFEAEMGDLDDLWTFDPATQTFTLIDPDLEVNLENECYLEMIIEAPTGDVANGLITARRRPKNELYVQTDYRGTVVRRYKSNAANWSAGTTPANQVRKYGGYVWGALVATTATPSTSNDTWIRLFIDDYVLSKTYTNIGGMIIRADNDFQDVELFDASVLDGKQNRLNINLLSYQGSGEVDVRFIASILNSYNSTIKSQQYGSTIVEYIRDTTVTCDNVVSSRFEQCDITLMKDCATYWLKTCLGSKLTNSSFYNIRDCRFSGLDGNLSRSLFEVVTVGYMSNSLFRSNVRNIITTSMNNNKFHSYVTNMFCFNFFSNVFYGPVADIVAFGSFYSNIFNTNFYRCKFMARCYQNTFGYTADNTFNGNVAINQFTGTSPQLFGNIINGSFSNNTLSHNNLRITNNIFCTFYANYGDGRATIDKNKLVGDFNGNEFLTGGTTIIARNEGTSFGKQGTSRNRFSAVGNCTVEENVFLGPFFKATLTNGAEIKYSTFAGKVIDNLFDGCSFEYNTVAAGFEGNTVPAGTYEGNEYPVGYSGVVLSPASNQTLLDHLFLESIKTGATQAGAGAAAKEFWRTSGHATLPDNVLMLGV